MKKFLWVLGVFIALAIVTACDTPDLGQAVKREHFPHPDGPEIIGKVVAGYQAWFNTSSWHHWRSDGTTGLPRPGVVNVELWPAGWEDYRANGVSFRNTGFTMPDGSNGRLFNSKDAAVIRTHFQWMRDAGIDGAAVQRFYEETRGTGSGSHLTLIRNAAESTGRLFYIMYDMSAAGRYDNVLQQIRSDWNSNCKTLTRSENYARAEDKPVVCIWGVHAIESTDNYRYPKVETAIQLINWFREQGCYVIGGIPDASNWTEPNNNRHPRGIEMYTLFDMISPWYIGGGTNITGENGRQTREKRFCRDNLRSWANNTPIAFMPTIWPGFAWTNMSGNQGQPNATPRNSGQHIWENQIQRYLNADTDNTIKSLYLAMFDEYDEGTAWMKASVDFFDIPLDQYFLTHAADGKWLSSDYYLRLAKAAIETFKTKARGTIGPLNDYGNANSVIVEHSEGPVFWRNSFERRTGRSKYPNAQTIVTIEHLQIDVGVPNGEVRGTPQNITITENFTINRPNIQWNNDSHNYTHPLTNTGMVYTTDANPAKSGNSAFRLAGTRTAGSSASYLYKIADTRVKVSSAMSLTYWQRAENSLGANVVVDLLLDNGAYLSNTAAPQNDGAAQSGWQKKKVDLPESLNGRYITAVIIAYKDNGTATGGFAALIDDIVISNQ